MTIEILYFDGCPNSEAALRRVREALDSVGAVAGVHMVEVRDWEEAVALRFLGSPTIRVDGEDIESEARQRRDFGYTCRTYLTPEGPSGVPPMQMIVRAIAAYGTPKIQPSISATARSAGDNAGSK